MTALAAVSVAYAAHEGGQTTPIPPSWLEGEALFGDQVTHEYNTDMEDCSMILNKTTPDEHDSLLNVTFDCESEYAGTILEYGEDYVRWHDVEPADFLYANYDLEECELRIIHYEPGESEWEPGRLNVRMECDLD